MDLSAAKILVVLVVALLVLGPDRLPNAARQAGRLANDVLRFRDGLHAEVREAFGDPRERSARPDRGRAFMDSFTAEVLSSTSTPTGETSTPGGGPLPGDAASQARPDSGTVAGTASAGAVGGVGRAEPNGSGFDREFN